jgi:hypothetical protein
LSAACLLQLMHTTSFTLTEFIGNNIPHYAILPQTWKPVDDNITFKT